MDDQREKDPGTKAGCPRVLIVGEDVVEGFGGGGVTMSCLYKGWPQERIAVASGWYELGASGFAGHYYRLGALEDRWMWPLSLLPRAAWRVSGPVVPAEKERGESTAGAEPSPLGRVSSWEGRSEALGRRLWYAALRVAGAEALMHGLHLLDSLLAWVEEFHPDVIYSQLASLGLIRLVDGLARKTGVPVALHFMDDWPTTLYREGLLAGHLRHRLDRELRALLERAALLMVISDDMARAFSNRYGREFVTFHNALDLEEWAAVRRVSWERGHPFQILYAGRIGFANQASLLDVARATEALASDGLDVRFTVLTLDMNHPAAVSMSGLAHVGVLPAIPHSEVPARLASADLLVLPLDFEERAQDFARFSMPTKTVEYMATGTPTLVYAPAENAVSRYAAAGGWGHVVGTRSGPDLTAALRLLVEDPVERERLARRSVELALAHHDAGPLREAFRAALGSISGESGTAR
jgi:glycosyltransferase involved in cell wall biosynthesis